MCTFASSCSCVSGCMEVVQSVSGWVFIPFGDVLWRITPCGNFERYEEDDEDGGGIARVETVYLWGLVVCWRLIDRRIQICSFFKGNPTDIDGDLEVAIDATFDRQTAAPHSHFFF